MKHFQVLPLKIISFFMDSGWFQGSSDIIAYEIEALIATKLRALYQRRKGRDLFDLWYVASYELINLSKVCEIFSKCCAYNSVRVSREEFIKNLAQKKDHRYFHVDMSNLLPSQLNWNLEEAWQYVVENTIGKLL